jgi:hypothetical protein
VRGLAVHLGLEHGLIHSLLPDEAKVSLRWDQARSASTKVPPGVTRFVKIAPATTRPTQPPAPQAVCYLCGYQAERGSSRESLRYIMYSHYAAAHFKDQLGAYIRSDGTCLVCHKKEKSRKLLWRHLALAHNLLEDWLPEERRIAAAAAAQPPPPSSRRIEDNPPMQVVSSSY